MNKNDILKIVVDNNSMMINQNLEDQIFKLLISSDEKIDNDLIELILDSYKFDKLKRSIINEMMKANISQVEKKEILICLIKENFNEIQNIVQIIVKADEILKNDTTGELFENIGKMQSKNIISVDIHDTIQKAKHEDGNAQNDLANFYTFGFGVEMSYEKAELLYKKAIENGCQDAKINLATIYHELGRIEEWEKILEELAKNGDKTAMYDLSVVYLKSPKKRDKGIEMLNKLVLEGYDIAAKALGEYYLYTVKDVKKACEYYKECKNIYDLNITKYYLGYENMIDVDIEEATKISNYLLNKGYLEEKYNTDILNSLNGKEVLKANSFKEIHDMEIDENIYGAVAVNGDLYSIGDYQNVKQKINEFLMDVEENNGKNEFDIFMKIYLKIISEIRYDYSVTMDSEDSVSKIKNLYTHRNLIGALVDKNCVCEGYAKVLRELLEFRGIDSINIENDEHTHLFNQVKINNKWYYADVTFDYSNVQNGNELSNCLVSKNSFPKCSSHEDNNSNVYEAKEDYSQDIVKEYFDNFKKQYLISEYRNNSMFRFPFLSDIIEKFKQRNIGKRIIDFFDR